MSKYGLTAHEIKLVYYRAVKEMPFENIVKKQGWVSRGSAEYYYKKALKKLREGRFTLK